MTTYRKILTKMVAALLVVLAATPATVGPAGAIVNGRVAPADILEQDWPFYAQLQRTGWSQWCGATVVSTTTVLTAAHCVDGNIKASELWIDLEAIPTPGGLVQRDIVAIELEPSWNGSTGNDLAILRLDSPVSSAYVAELADLSESPIDKYYVAGRGLTEQGGTSSPDIKEAGLQLVEPEDCPLNPALRSGQYCFEPFDGSGITGLTCNGDSGGPITIPDGNQYVLYAVVNSGTCGFNNVDKSVGASISHNRHWIEQTIAQTGEERVTINDNGDNRYRIVGLKFQPGASVRVTIVRDGKIVGYHYGIADNSGTANTSALVVNPTELQVGDELRVGERRRNGSGTYIERDYRTVYETVFNGPRLGADVDIRDNNDGQYRLVGTEFTPGSSLRIAVYRNGVHQGNHYGNVTPGGSVNSSSLVLNTSELQLGDLLKVGERRRSGNVSTGAYSNSDWRTLFSTTFTGMGQDERVDVRDNGDNRYRVVGLGFHPGASVRVMVIRDGNIVGYHWGLADNDGSANTSALVLNTMELRLGDEIRVGERRRADNGSYVERDYRVVYETVFNDSPMP